MIVAGIDPGVRTGLAVYRDGRLVECHSPAPGIGGARRGKGAKVDARGFALLTGWDGPTNQHSRDAAMAAYPYRNQMVLRGGIDLV